MPRLNVDVEVADAYGQENLVSPCSPWSSSDEVWFAFIEECVNTFCLIF